MAYRKDILSLLGWQAAVHCSWLHCDFSTVCSASQSFMWLLLSRSDSGHYSLLTWTSCADTHHLWIIQTRECARTFMLSVKLTDGDKFLFFHLFFSFSLSQKWKPKGTALQHMVSGLCLDSQTPTGPPVITQCRPQMASQSWEPQIITWATADRGKREREERCRFWTRPAEGLGGSHLHTVCRLAEGWKEWELYFCDVNFKLLLIGDKSVAENILRPCWAKHRRSFVYSASSLEDAAVLLRNLSFSLKTVAHLTFSFLYLSWSTICLKLEWWGLPQNKRVHTVL